MNQVHQINLFEPPSKTPYGYPVSDTDEVRQWLREGAVCALGVSGGKDSHAMAIRVAQYLDEVGHTGPRLLIHSDLGVVEWKDSLPACERLALRIGWDLVVLRRSAGDMMDRWEARWESSVRRYATMECVKLILPWSTPGMRFCTSELKADLICRELTKRYPGKRILSGVGVRHDESANRAKMPVTAVQPKLSARGCTGMNWNPIITWPTAAVYDYLEEKQEPLHEAYRVWGSTRVSCTFCIMSSGNDLHAASRCPDNAEIYRRMVQLEIDSTFGLQGSRWLGDVAPALLDAVQLSGLAVAKRRAQERVQIEAHIPQHLLYKKGWPTAVPTRQEADLLASIRRQISSLLGFEVNLTCADEIVAHYEGLMAARAEKGLALAA